MSLDVCAESLQQTNERLQQQVATLEADLDTTRRVLQTIVDTLPQMIFWKDRHSVYQGCDTIFGAAAGVASPHDIVGKHDTDLPWKPEEAAFFLEVDQRVMQTNTPEYNVIEPQRQANGREAWFRTNKVPLHNAAGHVIGILGTAEDITERMQQEEALDAANQRIEQFLESTPLATIEFNPDGMITHWNAAAEHIFGWPAAEALGHELLPLVVPPVAMDQAEDMSAALAAGQIINGQSETLTRDGDLITCRWYNTILRDDEDNVTSILSQVEDITAQVRREDELRLFKTMADNAPDGIAANALDGTITYANASYRAMHGYGPEIVGLSHRRLIPQPEELEPALQALEQTGFWQGTITHQRQDGSTFPVMASVFTIRNEAGYPIALAAIDRDITEQQHAEREREALQQQVIDAQRDTLRELSTPLIPISDDVVIMPLIGTVDTQRAQQIMENLLDGVTRHQARLAILDITGVAVVDTQVAQALIQVAQAVKLLGSQVMLTGIQPQIAQTLVQLGVDLRGIITRGTLQHGIAEALRGPRRAAA
jgi:rsbT co-antagonist protein RsbR